MFWRILLGIGAVITGFLVLTPVGRYLLRGAAAEVRILAGRQPIERLVRDTTIDPATRAKLQLVLDARTFAERSLGMRTGDSFTQFTQLDSDTLVLVLSVAHRDRLALRTWWWPIVGRVPYKGYFDVAAARRAQEQFERDGFDTELRPASAFSTLGWFNDPLVSTTLRADSAQLAETVIHELLHNTVWIQGDVSFNESFANFAGNHGAMAFFRARGDTAAAARVRAGWDAEQVLAAFYGEVYAALDSAFRAHPGDSARDARIAARDTVFAAARRRLSSDVAPALGVTDSTWAQRVRLNIATVLARRVYRGGLGEFEAVLASSGGDLRNAIARIGDAARAAPRGGAMAAVQALAAGR